MRVFMIDSDGFHEVGDQTDLALMRDKIRGWCNIPGFEQNTNWPALLDVLANTVSAVQAVPGDDTATLKAIGELTRDDIGTCLGMAAYVSALIGWDPKALLNSYAQLDSAVSGWIVGAIMIGANKHDLQVEVIWRVIDTLTPEERETVVAQLGATLHTLGFTADDVRALRATSTVD